MKDTESSEIPLELARYFEERDGAKDLAQKLPTLIPPSKVTQPTPDLLIWERIGLHYFEQHPQRRNFEALGIFFALYTHMMTAERESGQRVYKGMPLLWIAECFGAAGFAALRKRYLMLALCEDAVRDRGAITANESGLYFRLVWRLGMNDTTLRKYAESANAIANTNSTDVFFPEHILQQMDHNWMTELPTAAEANLYFFNSTYGNFLLERLGNSQGKALELFAEYVMRCMPGCRTTRRARSRSTDYDVICSMEGPELDFRSELGRYFVCECKDWSTPTDFSAFAKFCRVLDSVKAKFGIIFSKNGISGDGKARDAHLEQLKVYQDRGMVIVVVDQKDLEQVVSGVSFVSILRDKYERVRLGLIHPGG